MSFWIKFFLSASALSKHKNQHVVPSMLLKHFTMDGRAKSALHTCELLDERIRWGTKSPSKAGTEEHFYSVPQTSVTGNPQVVEMLLGEKMESKWDIVLQSVVKNSRLPTEFDAFSDLIQFAAFCAIRTPSFKKVVPYLLDRIGNEPVFMKYIENLFSLPTDHGSMFGYWPPFKQLIEGSRRKKMTQDQWVQVLTLYSPINFTAFIMRNWHLQTVEKDEAFLICTKNPVTVLSPSGDVLDASGALFPENRIILPLSIRHLLVSRETQQSVPSVISVEEVARINSYALRQRMLYLPERKFCFEADNGEVAWVEDI